MKGIIATRTELKDLPDYKSETLTLYNAGERVDVLENSDLISWYEIRYKDTFGYINFEHVYLLDIKYVLVEKSVNVMAMPDKNSDIVSIFEYGKSFYITEAISENNEYWIKVKEFYGNEGYIPITTDVKIFSEFEHEESSIEKSGIRMGVLGGFLMIAASVIWFFGAYIFFHRIFLYPPILFVIGVYALIMGLYDKNLNGK